jgi:hypothetical protein
VRFGGRPGVHGSRPASAAVALQDSLCLASRSTSSDAPPSARSRLCDRRRSEHSRRSESPRATIPRRASVKPKSSGPTPTEKTSTFIPDQQVTKRCPHPCGNATMLTKPRTARRTAPPREDEHGEEICGHGVHLEKWQASAPRDEETAGHAPVECALGGGTVRETNARKLRCTPGCAVQSRRRPNVRIIDEGEKMTVERLASLARPGGRRTKRQESAPAQR